MTFNSNMQQTEQAAIPELYDIIAGGYVWRYTSYRTDLSFEGNTYLAAGLKRSPFSVDRSLGSAKVTVSGYIAAPLQRYVGVSPLASAKIRIYRAVAGSMTDYAVLFYGVVERITVADKVIQAECTTGGPLRAKLPQIVYQSYCNWQVFDCDCGLVYSDWEEEAVITVSEDRAVISSAVFGAQADGYFTQGWIRFAADYRFIVNHVGNDVALQIPFGSDLINGETVYAVPGCDGSPATCKNIFDNWDRFCGMPYIPSRNPVVWGMR